MSRKTTKKKNSGTKGLSTYIRGSPDPDSPVLGGTVEVPLAPLARLSAPPEGGDRLRVSGESPAAGAVAHIPYPDAAVFAGGGHPVAAPIGSEVQGLPAQGGDPLSVVRKTPTNLV